MKLTIAIPTYDRPTELLETVARVVPQLRPDVELVILDNASPTPAAEVLEAVIAGAPAASIRIVRHPYNVGANANVLRCFECSEGEWVWVLGDDDLPHADAVETALRAVEAVPGALAFNFRSVHGNEPQNFVASGRTDLIDRFPSWGNLLFISTNLYRRNPLLAHLHMGYRFAYAMCPHVVLLLLALGGGGEVAFRDQALVSSETIVGPGHWSAINQALSIPVVLELPLSPDERRTLAGKLDLPDIPNLVIQLLGTGVKRGEFATSRFYYRQIFGRLRPYTSPGRRVAVAVGWVALHIPSISTHLVERVLRRSKGTTLMGRMRADTSDPRG